MGVKGKPNLCTPIAYMKKVKYFYNTNTLRYEKLVTPLLRPSAQ